MGFLKNSFVVAKGISAAADGARLRENARRLHPLVKPAVAAIAFDGVLAGESSGQCDGRKEGEERT